MWWSDDFDRCFVDFSFIDIPNSRHAQFYYEGGTATMLTVSESDVFVLNKLLTIVDCGILAIKNFPYASLTCFQTLVHGHICSYTHTQ